MTKRLFCDVVSRAELSKNDVQTMYSLFQTYYFASFKTFLRDLDNKQWTILLRDTEAELIQGFSTLTFYRSTFDGAEIGVVYSGDTIIHRSFWGTPELPRSWIKTVLEYGKALPKPLYWLLISSGYKTYRFLPVFFKEFYPCLEKQTPPEVQSIIHYLAGERFGPDYFPQLGVVRFSSGSTPLRKGIADITERRLKDPHIAFFVQKNPGHAGGDELVCLAEICKDNFTPAGLRMMR